MFFPLGTDRPRRRPTLVTYVLIAANVLITAGVILADRAGGQVVGQPGSWMQRLWLVPGETPWWSYVTYAFLHDPTSAWHLLGNVLFLWVFGPNVEDRLGRFGFAVFYLAGAVAAGLGHALVSGAPVVGASGAVSATGGAFLVLFPRTKIKTLIFFFLIMFVQVPALWFVGFHVFWDLVGLGATGGNVAHGAHLAGYGFGAALAMALLVSGVLKREPYDLFSIFKQRARKRAFEMASDQAQREAERRLRRAERDERSDELAALRGRVGTLLRGSDGAALFEAFGELEAKFGDQRSEVTLAKQPQLDLAAALHRDGHHRHAVRCYRRFLERYGSDPEAPSVRLMLALLLTRYTGQAAEAVEELRGLEDRLHEPAERELAGELRAEASAAGGQP